jgi:hypothetical protein
VDINDLKKPSFIISSAIALFFGILCWHQYYHPHRDRSISISDADISRIYDSKSVRSKLSVLDAHGAPVEGDVYLIKLAVWNSGSEPIESSDVRIPLTVGIKNCTRILDKNFFKERNPKVSRYALNETHGGDGEAFPFGLDGIVITWFSSGSWRGIGIRSNCRSARSTRSHRSWSFCRYMGARVSLAGP